MKADTTMTKKLALAATLSLFGLVAIFGCQTTQEKADAMVARTPATTTPSSSTPTPVPATKPSTPATAASNNSEWPKMMTIPAGTPLIVALQTRLRTDANKAGDAFRTNLTEAITVNNITVLPAGTEVRGQLTLVEEPHRTTGKAQMTLALQDVIDPSGDLRSVSAVPMVLVAEGDKISDEAKVASGAVIGGVIGALTSSKQRAKGAAVGAAAGAVAGGALALATKGNQLDLPAGQRFEFELSQPMTLPVTRQTSQLLGNSPTPQYAELHPKATAYQNSGATTYNDNQITSTTVADRASDALARQQSADAAALVRQQNADANALASKQAADAAAKAVWPKIVTVPIGTSLVMALQTHLRTDSNVTGDTFRAHLTDAVRVNDMTVFPIGTEVRGRLSLVEEPHRTSGKAQMTLTFLEVVDPAGFLHAITVSPVVLVGEGDKITDEAKVGAGAVIGGIIGALSSDKQRAKGAAVGAAAGAAAGGAVALATKGKQLDLPAGQKFSVELDETMRVSVTQLTASR